MVICFNALDEMLNLRTVFSDEADVFLVLFGSVRKQFVSVNLFNFDEVLKGIRERVLSR